MQTGIWHKGVPPKIDRAGSNSRMRVEVRPSLGFQQGTRSQKDTGPRAKRANRP